MKLFRRKTLNADDPQEMRAVATEISALRKQLQTLESVLTERFDRATVSRLGQTSAIEQSGEQWSKHAAYDPDLIPRLGLMLQKRIDNLEEWFRWGEDWRWVLRTYGRMTSRSTVLELGCGLGRTAFRIRYFLSEGVYDGFDIVRQKIDFLQQTFQRAYPNFRFAWADLQNSCYNPKASVLPCAYRFPYDDSSFSLVYAASVFTHLLPDTTEHYFNETARVLNHGGRCVFSFFLLDNYRPGLPRPSTFNLPWFNFDHPYGTYGNDFAVAVPSDPENTTAYRTQS